MVEDLDSCALQLIMSTDCTNQQAIKPSLINRWILDVIIYAYSGVALFITAYVTVNM